MTEKIVIEQLFKLQDLKYRDFHSRLMPTVEKTSIIGIRTPVLRKFAREFSKTPYAAEFVHSLPHKYYEENNLHAFIIETVKDYDLCIELLNEFLPFVDNWATCDMMRPKVFKKHLPELLNQIKIWIKSDDTYTVRFAINMLMCYYLDEEFKPEYLQMAAEIKTEEYYVKMVVAWYFATALAKQYESTIVYLEQNLLDDDTHNKTVRKAIESYRITPKQKEYIRTLKRN